MFVRRDSLKAFREILVAFIVALIFISSCARENPSGRYSDFWKKARKFDLTPTNVVDGDTFRIGKDRFRIIGIDTPEIHPGNKPIGEFGEDAKKFFEDFTERFKEGYVIKGRDEYGRNLVYLFARDGTNVYFYEASVTEVGLARPLIYEEDAVRSLSDDVIEAYKKAWKNRKGIFSKWRSAPVVKCGDHWKDEVGKIVWLEDRIEEVFETRTLYVARGSFSSIIARKDGYNYMFKDFDFRSLEGKDIKVYGELWEYDGHPEIMVRAPFEIEFLDGGDEK